MITGDPIIKQLIDLEFLTFQIRFKSEVFGGVEPPKRIDKNKIEYITKFIRHILDTDAEGKVEYIAFIFHYVRIHELNTELQAEIIRVYNIQRYSPNTNIELSNSTPEQKTISACSSAEEYFLSVFQELAELTSTNETPSFASVGFFLKPKGLLPDTKLTGKRFSLISFVSNENLLLPGGQVIFKNISYLSRDIDLIEKVKFAYPLMFALKNKDRLIKRLQHLLATNLESSKDTRFAIDCIKSFAISMNSTHQHLIGFDPEILYGKIIDIYRELGKTNYDRSNVMALLRDIVNLLVSIQLESLPDILEEFGITIGYKNMYYLDIGNTTSHWHMARRLNLPDREDIDIAEI